MARPSQLGLLGNPENRRVHEFSCAALQLGLQLPRVVSYRELLEGAGWDALEELDSLRIDSPGENEEVARALIALGEGPDRADLEFGEVAYLREYYRGYQSLLQRIARGGVRCLSHPDEIAVMFDKWACHQRFAQAGLSRPPAFLAPSTFDDLRKTMAAGGRLFLKPLHGSSASGVCALRWSRDRMQLMAPLRLVKSKLFNDLRVGRFERADEIEAILNLLLPQGMIAEQWIPKLSLPGGVVDLRILVLGGEARHVVVRQSRQPMTNLHLGNRRGDLSELRGFLGEDRWGAALTLAEQAALCFPRSLSVGVDILLDYRGRALIGEVNAFGDLLPGLTDRGETTYVAILKAWHQRLSVHTGV